MKKKPTAAEDRLRLAREQFMSLGPLDPRFAEAFNNYVTLNTRPDAESNVRKRETKKKEWTQT